LIDEARATPKAQARCVRSERGARLEIFGTLPISWLANLSLHCCGAGLNIESGLGCRLSVSRWAARFELSSSQRHDTPGFDFLRMARRESSGATRAAPPRLERFSLTRQPGGGLSVFVSGFDEPGFLAGVLQRFALFGLHPERFTLGSASGLAVDAFVLKSVGGREASPETIVALRGVLTGCVTGRGARSRRGAL
jgi:hypothetical protein